MEAQRSRPDIQNYGISTAAEGLLDWAWVDAQLEKSRNYWICSVRPDGRPHAAPVWGVWLDGALYFSSDPNSRKARNFAHNPEIVVHLESGDDTVILEGKVEQARDPAVLAAVNQRYAAKYPPYDPGADGLAFYYVLRPRVAFAWLERDYTGSATRWTFGA